jgi:hypothetical protein
VGTGQLGGGRTDVEVTVVENQLFELDEFAVEGEA